MWAEWRVVIVQASGYSRRHSGVLFSSQTGYLTKHHVCSQGFEKSVHGCWVPETHTGGTQREARREVRSEGKWRPEMG